MIIENLTLSNFRQYKGINNISFSTDPEKNVTVIIGDNTCGKTTLVQSFIWCLYGHTDFKDKKILNAEVREDLLASKVGSVKKAYVQVRLTHNGSKYIIERQEKNTLDSNGKILTEQNLTVYDLDEKGNATPIEKENNEMVINDILPENLSDYFFLWGERIEGLSERSELEDAVKKFLGLDVIAAAIEHLKLAVKKLTNENPAGFDSSDLDLKPYKEKSKELERESDKLKNEIETKNNSVKYWEAKRDDLYKKLTTSENKELSARQEEYKTKSKKLEEDRETLIRLKKNFYTHFNDAKNYVYYFSNDLENEAVSVLKNNPEPIIGWKYIDLNSINEIIKRKKCICGNEFCEGDESYKYLISQRNVVAPNVVGGVINSFIEEANRREVFNLNYYDLIHNDYKKISECNDEILELELRVSELSKYITGKSDMKLIHNKYKEANDNVTKESIALDKLKSQYNQVLENIKINENTIQIILKKNAKYTKQTRYISYAKAVLEIFNSDYERNETTLKNKLEKHVNECFQEAYNGERIIKIDEKYKAIPYNKVNGKWIVSEASPGLETVKNFSFIIGLVKCAKEKIIGENGEESANKNSYPLVLDAPFSNADEYHTPKVSKLISNNAEQIILVIMGKDWNFAKDALSSKVGKYYDIRKETETHTNIYEVKDND